MCEGEAERPTIGTQSSDYIRSQEGSVWNSGKWVFGASTSGSVEKGGLLASCLVEGKSDLNKEVMVF